MAKILHESLDEFRKANGMERKPEINEEEQLNEGVRDDVKKAVENPTDENLVNSAIKGSFKITDKLKTWMLQQPLEKKVKLLTAGNELFQKNSKLGYLKYAPNDQGVWTVGAVAPQGLNPGKTE